MLFWQHKYWPLKRFLRAASWYDQCRLLNYNEISNNAIQCKSYLKSIVLGRCETFLLWFTEVELTHARTLVDILGLGVFILVSAQFDSHLVFCTFLVVVSAIDGLLLKMNLFGLTRSLGGRKGLFAVQRFGVFVFGFRVFPWWKKYKVISNNFQC